MSTINSLHINISLQTKPVPQKGFGTLLAVGSGAAEIAFAYITEPADMIALGYLDTDEEYKMASAYFSQYPRPEKMAVYRKTSATAYDAALTSLLAANKRDWYMLAIQSRNKADIDLAAAWGNANSRFGLYASSDLTVADGKTGEYELHFQHKTPGDYPDVRAAGYLSARTPGSYILAYGALNGATNSGLTTTEAVAAEAMKANYFGEFYGSQVPYPGKVSSGHFMDAIILRDYVDAKLKEAYAFLLLNLDVLPYDLGGFALAASETRTVFKSIGKTGGIARVYSKEDMENSDDGLFQYKVTTPDNLTDIPSNDRANRKAPLTFWFRMSSGMQEFDVTGTVVI